MICAVDSMHEEGKKEENAMSRMRKFVPLVIVAALTVGVLVGCPWFIPTGFTLTLENYSGTTMTEMNIRPENYTTWGADQLRGDDLEGDGSVNSVREITSIPQGVYDLRAIFGTPPNAVTLFRYDVPFDSNWRWVFGVLGTIVPIADPPIVDTLTRQ